jgi:hypothetical protein
MSNSKKVLILGLFVDASAKKQNIRTSDDRIAFMFAQNGIEIITSSAASSKFKRLIETAGTLVRKKRSI